MKRPKLEDTKTPSGHQSIGGRSVNVYTYSKMQDEYIDYLESKVENFPISHVRFSLDDFPENMPLYKDSGLWQLRSDDMEDVILHQQVNQSDADFITACRYLSEA